MDKIDEFFNACFGESIPKSKCSTPSKNKVDIFMDQCVGKEAESDKTPALSMKTRTEKTSKPRVFTWRKKQSNMALSKRYLDEGYVAKLVMCKFLPEYDNGSKPICNEHCSHNCQNYFRDQMDVLREELTQWWGEHSDSTLRRALLYEDITLGTEIDDDGNNKPQKWLIRRRQVCKNFYLRARGIQKEIVRKVSKEISDSSMSFLGATADAHLVSQRQSRLAEDISSWIDTFAKGVGEKLPDDTVTVLPYNDIRTLYEEYTGDCETATLVYGKPASYSHFCDTFNNVSNRMKIRLTRNSGSFVVCPCCNSYKISLRKAKTPQERARIKSFRNKHLNKQRAQREKYYKHRRKAVGNPKKYLSIIIDGMDQKKTNCPSLGGATTKDEAPLKQRIIGVKVHGIRNYVFIADQFVPGGGNIITEVLRLTLNDLHKRGELPNEDPVLYLQVDNCGENKNRTMFAFLTDLVQRGIFAKVKVGFLMVGHTHEDIDQLFSTISMHFRSYKTCCPDPLSVCSEIVDAFQQLLMKPTVILLNAKEIFDYKELYNPVIDDNIKYHQEPHQFVIKKILGTVLLRYKFWSNSSFWLPMASKMSTVTEQLTGAPTESTAASEDTNKRRKMARGQVSRGQLAAKIRSSSNVATRDSPWADVIDPEDNLEWTPLNVPTELTQDDLLRSEIQQPPGIRWISQSPNLDNVSFVSFSEQQHHVNYKEAQKIYDVIITKFAPKYKSLFNKSVQSNWTNWLQKQQQLWTFDASAVRSGPMVLPPPFATRTMMSQQSLHQSHEEFKDCAAEDPEETLEIITHDSGLHGQFSAAQRIQQIREAIATAEEYRNENSPVVLKKACIFVYSYFDVVKKNEVHQIGVGVVEKIHGDASSPASLFDIKFCPPKGALPAKGVIGSRSFRPDSLYQDITCDMQFNQNYITKKGKKIESENKGVEKSVMLVFNLTLNERQGGFCKKRDRNDSIYNMSSYEIARAVIQEWNTPDRRKEIIARISQNL